MRQSEKCEHWIAINTNWINADINKLLLIWYKCEDGVIISLSPYLLEIYYQNIYR